ncbi:putative ribosomal protein S16 [Helianthus annuus]|nr:putative ribosomal protein S16 [Helianthus annuus]
MVVRLRLARLGCRNRPFYRVMAADSRSPRDGKHIEVLGYYNPLPGQDGGKRMGLNFERVKLP